MGQAARHALPDLCGRALGVVERRVGPALDTAGEGASDACAPEQLMKALELCRATLEADDMHGLSSRGGLAHHVDGITGNHQRVGMSEQPEVGILAGAAPEV